MAREDTSSGRSASRSRSRSRSSSVQKARRVTSKSQSRSVSVDGQKERKTEIVKDGDMEIDGDNTGKKCRSLSITKDKKSAMADACMSPSKVFSLRVDNLTRNVNADHLSEIFGKFGAVVSVDLVCERVSKASKGFAFVDFHSEKDAEKAQDHMHDGWLDGKKVRVRFATDDDRRRSRSRSMGRNSQRNGNQNGNNNSSNANGRRGRENMPRNKRSFSPRGRRGSLASPLRKNNRHSVGLLCARMADEELVVQRRHFEGAAAVHSMAVAGDRDLVHAHALARQLSVAVVARLLSEAVVAADVAARRHSAVAVVDDHQAPAAADDRAAPQQPQSKLQWEQSEPQQNTEALATTQQFEHQSQSNAEARTTKQPQRQSQQQSELQSQPKPKQPPRPKQKRKSQLERE